MANATSKIAATGKRKTAVARVRLELGTGSIIVNGKVDTDYFVRAADQLLIRKPLEATDSVGRFDIVASIHGAVRRVRLEPCDMVSLGPSRSSIPRSA